MTKKLLFGLLMAGMMICGSAAASWNPDWAGREKININTADDGVAIKGAVEDTPILVRLHTGNFSFTDAKPDGSDLRFIADDDKTPLKFHIERFDSVTELALIWVNVPKLAPGNKNGFIWLYYNNPKAPPASDAKTTYDVHQTVVFHFDEKDPLPKDATAYGNNASEATDTPSTDGVIGAAATFNGTQHIVIPASSSLTTGTTGITASVWVKPEAGNTNAILFKQTDGANSIALTLQGDKVLAQVNGAGTTAAGALTPGAWHQVTLTGHDNLVVYVDGQQVSEASVRVPNLAGTVEIGNGFKGELDEFGLANVQRSADWVRIEAGGLGVDQRLITYTQAEAGDDSGGVSYFKILLGSVTPDGWVVIGILMVMMVVSFTVMVLKALYISKASKANAAFKESFSGLGNDLLALAPASSQRVVKEKSDAASMQHIYRVGAFELRKRFAMYKESGRPMILTAQSIAAIRASLDAILIRELQRLNAQMVLLTIAIAGGPFLGLLGTVVGVMITFAAIAAAGDVNVNAIAPGIAAALVATVAGLGVAIPSLFGYNYLASKIKELTTDMQVFVDEFVTRLAENYSE
jgi:biopolymer transport protein ExbB